MKKDSKGDYRHFENDNADELLEQAMDALKKIMPPEKEGENENAEHIESVLHEFHARLKEGKATVNIKNLVGYMVVTPPIHEEGTDELRKDITKLLLDAINNNSI
jgi:uncharacterized protein (UPF0297 family)